jgi:hypothetical protein
VHNALIALYPQGQAMSANMEYLASFNEFIIGKSSVEALKAELDAALANTAAKHAAVSKEVEDRSSLRLDIADLTNKVHAMEAKPDPKQAAKLEELKAKLAETTARFEEADMRVNPMMDALDKDLADIVNGAFKGFLEASQNFHATAAESYGKALAAVASAAPAAAADAATTAAAPADAPADAPAEATA